MKRFQNKQPRDFHAEEHYFTGNKHKKAAPDNKIMIILLTRGTEKSEQESSWKNRKIQYDRIEYQKNRQV